MTRLLTPTELSEARKIFGYSVELEKVTINSGWLTKLCLKLNGGRNFTLGHTIYALEITLPVLMHELTHVWQYERYGWIVAVEAVWSQWFGKGYVITGIDLEGDFNDLEREQQATVIQDYYVMETAWPEYQNYYLMILSLKGDGK